MDKKICFVSSRPGFIDGENAFRMDWANARLISFLNQEYKLSVAIFSDPINTEKYNVKLQVRKVYGLPFPFSHPGGMMNVGKIRRILKTLENENDILIIQLPIIGFPALLTLRKPIVFHICANVFTAVNNPIKYTGAHALIAKIFARSIHSVNRLLFKRNNTRVIVNGNELATLYREFNPSCSVSSSLIKEDINEQMFRPPVAGNIFRIIFVGRPSLEKGFDVLIKSLMKTPVNFHLTVIGFTKAEFNALLPEIYEQSFAIHSRISFRGYINWGDEFKNILRHQDILIVPSRSEGTPRVILEAMSQGTPVIASWIGGIPDLIEENKTGLLFEVASEDELENKIGLVSSSAEMQRRMSLAGIEFAKKNTIEQFASHFKKNIESLING